MHPRLKPKASENSNESKAIDESTKESGQENFSRATEVIVQLVTKFDSDPDCEFAQSDLDVLFQLKQHSSSLPNDFSMMGFFF